MFSSKDYSTLTLDELVSEEKKMKSQKTVAALFIGILIGIAIWAATHKGGFFVTIVLLFLAFRGGYKTTQNLKSIQAEISRRNTVG
ncbi:hypothetical protein [Hymenobacter sp. IS2118]|uniref:hypothetical protein n=1 Tax=Hymenobacter sp. IS2118 TaxID=1505605 RepID=UPI00054D8CBD|nr:hypothetical protein [Hymenobacter sp. IS2118]